MVYATENIFSVAVKSKQNRKIQQLLVQDFFAMIKGRRIFSQTDVNGAACTRPSSPQYTASSNRPHNKIPAFARSQFPADIPCHLIVIYGGLHGGFNGLGGVAMAEKIEHHRDG